MVLATGVYGQQIRRILPLDAVRDTRPADHTASKLSGLSRRGGRKHAGRHRIPKAISVTTGSLRIAQLLPSSPSAPRCRPISSTRYCSAAMACRFRRGTDQGRDRGRDEPVHRAAHAPGFADGAARPARSRQGRGAGGVRHRPRIQPRPLPCSVAGAGNAELDGALSRLVETGLVFPRGISSRAATASSTR